MVATPMETEGFRRGRYSVTKLQYNNVSADQKCYFLLVRCQMALFTTSVSHLHP
jgi:hypothetical protein